MPRTDYYGTRLGTTRLELFWETEDGERLRHRMVSGQDAYDAWHIPGYLRELLSSRRLAAADAVAFDRIPRPEKHLLLYLVLATDPRLHRILELGSSLMEIVDGLEAVHAWARSVAPGLSVRDPRSLTYGGVEISSLCAELSVALHPQVDIVVHRDVTCVDRQYDVLFDRIVSGSAFLTAQEGAAFINRCEVAVMNLFVSKGQTFVVPMVGRPFTYFSLAELSDALDRPLFHLFGERAPREPGEFAAETPVPAIEGFFLAASERFVRAFVETAARIPDAQAYFEGKRIVPRDARLLLD